MKLECTDEVIALRILTLDDAPALVKGEDDDTVRWLTGGPGTLETADRHIITSSEQWQTGGPRKAWGIYDLATGALSGTAEVHLALDSLTESEANISYSVFPAFRGRGYAVRAVNLVCKWLTTETNRTTAVIRVDPANTFSAQIPSRCGFIERGMIITPDHDHLMKYARNVADR
jgi:RimJ/RimL family protein N-acetyltransferase